MSLDGLRILGERDVRAVIDRRSAVDLASRTLLEHTTEASRLSEPSAMRLDASDEDGVRFLFKAAAIGHGKASGIRLIAGPSGSAAMYTLVFDPRTGRPVGLVSARWLSDVRAAAFAVAAIQPLLPRRPLNVGIIGAGSIAREMAHILVLMLEIRELRIASRRPETRQAIVDAVAPGAPCIVRAEPDIDRLVAEGDLVFTLTSADAPLVRPGLLRAGAVVCSMGNGNELDYGVLAEADRLIVDDLDYATLVGDGAAWIAQGWLTPNSFAQRVDALAADVVAGRSPGRRSEDDRVVALIQGMATGDVAFAHLALTRAESSSLGQVVDPMTNEW